MGLNHHGFSVLNTKTHYKSGRLSITLCSCSNSFKYNLLSKMAINKQQEREAFHDICVEVVGNFWGAVLVV